MPPCKGPPAMREGCTGKRFAPFAAGGLCEERQLQENRAQARESPTEPEGPRAPRRASRRADGG